MFKLIVGFVILLVAGALTLLPWVAGSILYWLHSRKKTKEFNIQNSNAGADFEAMSDAIYEKEMEP